MGFDQEGLNQNGDFMGFRQEEIYDLGCNKWSPQKMGKELGKYWDVTRY